VTLLDGHARRIDLRVTDVVIPGMSGRELAEAHIFQKPFTPTSLLVKVREGLAHA
jgi:hypothetical protein